MQRITQYLTLFVALLFATVQAGSACDVFDVTTDAAIQGTFGLKVVFGGDVSDCFVMDESPNAERVYSAELMIRNLLTNMPLRDGHQILRAQGPTGPIFQVLIKRITYGYYIWAYSFKDDGSRSSVLLTRIPDGTQQFLKFEWAAASVPGANDGLFRVLKARKDGTWACLKQSINIDSDQKGNLDKALLGSFTGIDAITTGELHYDSFASFRTIETAPSCALTFPE